jgi:ankyrin repeat protein
MDRTMDLAGELHDVSCIISRLVSLMRIPNLRAIPTIAFLLVVGVTGLGPELYVRSPISSDDLVRAMVTHRPALIDFYLNEHLDPDARWSQGRPLILVAALQQNWETVRRLIDAGARVDIPDANGFTPLMAAAMHGNLEMFHTLLERAEKIDLGARCRDGRDLLWAALDGGNPQIIEAILQGLPLMPQWTAGTQRLFHEALRTGNNDRIRMLIQKHAVPPTPEGKNVPLLAYAIAQNDPALFNTLLACGADPNTAISGKYDKEFLASLSSKTFRNYIEDDKNVTVLMLAAGLNQPEYVRALLEAGADRNRATARYKMLALYFAAQTGNWRCTQILLGSGPSPDQLRLEITLASQHVALVKNGVPVFNTVCSTGREGFSTRRGDYVITDKDRNHWSTIYKVEMPYFMRLSCLDFGMHEGVVPNYPASHGCIRLPGDAARKFFAEIPIGTLVTVK